MEVANPTLLPLSKPGKRGAETTPSAMLLINGLQSFPLRVTPNA